MKSTATTDDTATLSGFLEVVGKDLRRMINDCGLHYLSFSIMGGVIELLGAALDDKPFSEEGISRQRFNSALQQLPSLHRYQQHYIGVDHDLYVHMRCGMAHVVLTGKGVVFTQRGDPTDGTRHLKTDSYRGVKRLILVCEDLYNDIIQAIQEIHSKSERVARLGQRFMDPSLSPDGP
ncbi:MAG: hypothetical protein ACYDDA_06260 [Acidiferrobacteraceae bacterium]